MTGAPYFSRTGHTSDKESGRAGGRWWALVDAGKWGQASAGIGRRSLALLRAKKCSFRDVIVSQAPPAHHQANKSTTTAFCRPTVLPTARSVPPHHRAHG